jgi:hypothetical protein
MELAAIVQLNSPNLCAQKKAELVSSAFVILIGFER